MDFARILDEWENRGDRRDRLEGKDEEAPVQVSRQTMEKASVQDQLDLHGLRVDEALAHLRLFLRDSRLAGYTKVLVIHGKGLHSENQRSVLKEAVHQALGKDKNVKTWGEAGRRDGGRGASWVWLSARGK